ncbi:hypothetical protein [Thermoflavimicrobium dichotomicum]|uniref:Uncharacterized protein n=1 Tax=Thermoflavimicrobium dichotomicum TaxID=46223 RepID=A0A1I3UVQ5_9BACL|nr:hypothetical protein [Thermoflavimicrobium dichotomicum]SFJ87135.1 hypothetical protein SAMN05421852_1292 [Thermoflavimicrobium dichotomicum]
MLLVDSSSILAAFFVQLLKIENQGGYLTPSEIYSEGLQAKIEGVEGASIDSHRKKGMLKGIEKTKNNKSIESTIE